MYIKLGKPVLFVAVCLLAAYLCTAITACGGGFSREELDEIDMSFRAGAAHMAETTSFIGALEGFDFENAAFLDEALAAVDSSRDAAEALLTSIEDMKDFSYKGALSPLGGYIEEYSAYVTEAVEELDAVYTALQEMLLAVEPVLREEAVITHLDTPGSDEELAERLERLRAALVTSLAELTGIEVPDQLAAFKATFTDLFTTLQKLVVDLLDAAYGRAASGDPENNPDFLYMQELLADYPGLIGEIRGNLKIGDIDPLLEKIELEINRLYLEESE